MSFDSEDILKIVAQYEAGRLLSSYKNQINLQKCNIQSNSIKGIDWSIYYIEITQKSLTELQDYINMLYSTSLKANNYICATFAGFPLEINDSLFQQQMLLKRRGDSNVV